MKRNMNRKLKALLVLLLTPAFAFAQLEQPVGMVERVVNQIVALAPLIILGGFLIGAIANIGKVWGSEQRDYMGFFMGIIKFGVAVAAIVGIAAFIRSVSF
ncbi:hypothetical protein [Ekhidna sp.]